MKIADVKIGETYLTTVSGSRVKVVVVQRIEPDGRFQKQTRFIVKRVDNGKVLDKRRAASALRQVVVLDPVAQALLKQVNAAHLLERAGKWDEAVVAWNALAKDAENAGRLGMVSLANSYAKYAQARAKASDTAK